MIVLLLVACISVNGANDVGQYHIFERESGIITISKIARYYENYTLRCSDRIKHLITRRMYGIGKCSDGGDDLGLLTLDQNSTHISLIITNITRYLSGKYEFVSELNIIKLELIVRTFNCYEERRFGGVIDNFTRSYICVLSIDCGNITWTENDKLINLSVTKYEFTDRLPYEARFVNSVSVHVLRVNFGIINKTLGLKFGASYACGDGSEEYRRDFRELIVNVKHLSVNLGSKLLLLCDDSFGRIVHESFDGSTVRYISTDRGLLIINRVESTDNGIYVCICENSTEITIINATTFGLYYRKTVSRTTSSDIIVTNERFRWGVFLASIVTLTVLAIIITIAILLNIRKNNNIRTMNDGSIVRYVVKFKM